MKKILYPVILLFLRVSARLQLAKIHPTIIGIAGSSGKTSLVSLIGGMLSQKHRVLQTVGQNSETGLPLFILGIIIQDNSFLDWIRIFFLIPFQLLFNWKPYDVFVAEMGIDGPKEPKNMSYLLRIIQPTIMAITNVSLEHSLYFEPFAKELDPKLKKEEILQMTADQETLPLTLLEEKDWAIVNLDDPLIAQTNTQGQKITVSTLEKADLTGIDITNAVDGFSMTVYYKNKPYALSVDQPLPNHFAYEFLLALGVAISLDFDIEESIAYLKKHFTLPPGRMSLFNGIDNTIIIDSTYNNATLPPILDVLEFTKEIAGDKRAVAILGDMRELGEQAQEAHETVAQKILETVDFAILIGPLSEKYIAPILEKAEFPFEDFPDVTSSKKAILNLIQENDVVLIKGSQNTLFLERIVEMLLEDKSDVAKLTRRGTFWDTKRSESL